MGRYLKASINAFRQLKWWEKILLLIHPGLWAIIGYKLIKMKLSNHSGQRLRVWKKKNLKYG